MTDFQSRVQLALNVDDVDEAVAFYSTLFGTEPAKRRPGYANFAVAQPPLKLVLLENPGHFVLQRDRLALQDRVEAPLPTLAPEVFLKAADLLLEGLAFVASLA